MQVFKRSLFGLAAASFLLFNPAPYAFADSVDGSTPSESASCSPAALAPSGIKRPTGSDASTYTYNSCTGLWENAYYTWSPTSQVATPKTPLVFTCDTSTWRWATNVWVYDPAAGKFAQITSEQKTLPAGAAIVLARGSDAAEAGYVTRLQGRNGRAFHRKPPCSFQWSVQPNSERPSSSGCCRGR